jgi:hypothetical protein
VAEVTAVRGTGDRRELDLVDRFAGYDVVPAGEPDGAAVDAVPGRADAGVRMVLVRTAQGWRIDTAQRLP